MTAKIVKLVGVTTLGLLVAACGAQSAAGGGGARPVSAGMRPVTAAQRPAPPAQAGELLGRDRAGLIALFGPPRLDTAEGAARALQFASDRCVLDVYLYPPRDGAEPQARHADARDAEGAEVDQAACVASFRRR